MNHMRARELLSAYLERDLEEVARTGVEAHLADCDRCGAELQDLRATVALLRRLPAPEPPLHLATRVMARIADGEARPAGLRAWLAKLAAPLVAAPLAAAVAAAVVVWFAEPPKATQVAVAAPVGRPTVPIRVGPKPPAVIASWTGQQPYALARRLRGAGHPHSTSLAAQFDRPADAVVVSWKQR